MKTNDTKDWCLVDIPQHPRLHEIANTTFIHLMFRHNQKHQCGCCESVFDKHHEVCPNCKNKVEKRLITVRTHEDSLTNEYRVEAFQVYQGMMILNQYSIVQRFIHLKEVIEIEEIERTVIYQGKTHQFFNVNDDCRYNYYYSKGWLNGRLNENSRLRRPKHTYHLLPNSFEEALKDTEVKYTMIGKQIDDEKPLYMYLQLNYLSRAAAYPWIEYVYKIGGSNLYHDIVSGRADMRVVRKNSIKQNIPYIKANNPNALQFFIKLMAKRNGIIMSDEFIRKVTEYYDCLTSIKAIHEITKITEYPFEKTYKYIENLGLANNTINEYRDYIEMMIKLDCKPNTDLLVYPKDFKKAHDEAVKKFNVITHKANNEVYKTFRNELLKFSYRNDKYAIVVPNKLEEIIDEGKTLNHCVGSYVDRVLKKETAILFVRKLDEMDTPLFTTEFRNNSIVQCRGLQNILPSGEVREFIDEWKAWLIKPKKKRVKHQQMVAYG